MFLWLAFVDGIRAVLLTLAHVAGGSIGSGILALSLLVRIALLPLTVKVALRARENGEKLRALEPALKQLRDRHKNDPAKVWAETRVLHEKHGISFMPKGTGLNMLIQFPLGAAVYRVVAENATRAGRFLWMSDLARPDVFITGLAASVASLAVLAMPNGNASNKGAAIMTAVVTAVVVWRMAAGVGLYWVGSSVVNVAQALIVRSVARRR